MNRTRICTTALAAAMLVAGHAGASSIIEIGRTEAPSADSIVTLAPSGGGTAPAEPVPGEGPVAITDSVVAIGEPAVGLDNTAAIGTDDRRSGPPPMVIRGGISGAPFTRAAPTQAAAPSAEAAPAPSVAPEPSEAPAEGGQDAPAPVFLQPE